MKEFWIILGIVSLVGFLISLLLDRVISPWLARRWLNKTLQEIKPGKSSHRRFELSIRWDSEGFFVQQDKTQEKSPRLVWARIAKVTAFKRDLWSTDRICLSFDTTDDKEFEVHEQMNGWYDFTQELPTFLLGCKPLPDWIWNVAAPAFAPNVTVVFSRPEATQASGGSA